MTLKRLSFDVLVIGTGAAGLNCALEIEEPARVAVISKGTLSQGATQWAQGGIAAVLSEDDSVEAHVQDTLVAGAQLCHPDIVEKTIKLSAAAINKLHDLGVPFTTESDNQWHLTREGGHAHRRIIHVADATGKAVHEKLLSACKQKANISLFEQWLAIDLIQVDGRVAGAWFVDLKTGAHHSILAQKTVLATGGASRAYLYSTNPDVSSGDGIAMAWRAGCRVANLEFNQFHPTCLYHPGARLLLTEAIRGEGGILTLKDGTRFMSDYHSMAELAPRDVVARAIDAQMKRTGDTHVLLDISHAGAALVEKRFPMLIEQCLKYGYDLRLGPVPVVPAAHYTCGGIVTDFSGQTDIENLYAIGEVACTGLHGANRLASNSLLECLVFSQNAAMHINRVLQYPTTLPIIPKQPTLPKVDTSISMALVSHNWDAIRRTMWNLVGICRNTERLQQAQTRLAFIESEIKNLSQLHQIHPNTIELKNLLLISQLIVRSALSRKESRGLHFTEDFPNRLAAPEDTILSPAALPIDAKLTNFQVTPDQVK